MREKVRVSAVTLVVVVVVSVFLGAVSNKGVYAADYERS